MKRSPIPQKENFIVTLLRFLGSIFLLLGGHLSYAQEPEVELLPIKVDISDTQALQRGAKIYMNYCSGCHSLRYLRYNKMAEGLGLMTFEGKINTPLLMNNLVFTQALVQDPIVVSLPKTEARQWFGVIPPDLSLEVRARGASWVYTYLKSFYVDASRPFGANNLLIPGVAMPNVLAPLQGTIALRAPLSQENAHEIESLLLLLKEGKISELEFNRMIYDIVTFLTYVSEPDVQAHHRLGIAILLYLLIFWMIVSRLKKQIWSHLKEKKLQNEPKRD